jgi:hypothetical protein
VRKVGREFQTACPKAGTRKKNLRPGVVAHACDPTYVGGSDLEDLGLRLAQVKS